MMRAVLFAACLALAPLMVHAATPDITGTWQGKVLSQHVLKIAPAPGGKWSGMHYSIDGNDPSGYPAAITFDGSSFVFTVDQGCVTDRPDGRCRYEGKLSADGKSIAGTWQTFGDPKPMTLERATRATAWTIDPSPHKSQFVAVAPNVSLEVLDWGGSGPPLLFLSGLGGTAHVFDEFAPKFTASHHVYGITRRGYGLSGKPSPIDENYNSDRLGDDVLAVIDALKLERPVLAGHSIAGEELSSIGTRHPEKVSGLIYLDAASMYAFYEPQEAASAAHIESNIVYRDIQQLFWSAGEKDAQQLIDEIKATLPALLEHLQAHADSLKGLPGDKRPMVQQVAISRAVYLSARKYTGIKAPFLSIVATPHQCEPRCDSSFAKNDAVTTKAQADAIQAEYPAAKTVRLPYANHFVFRSNEADVLREMNAFMAGLPK